MSSAKTSWSSAIQAWYNEVKNFKYGVGSFNGGVVGHYTQVQPVPNSAALESLRLLRETDCRPLAKVSMNWAPGHFTTQSAGCLVQVVPSRLCYGPLSQCWLPVLLRLPVLPTVSVAHTPYLDIDRIRCFASWFFFFFFGNPVFCEPLQRKLPTAKAIHQWKHLWRLPQSLQQQTVQ